MIYSELDNNGLALQDGYIRIYCIEPNTSEFTHAVDEYIQTGIGIPSYSTIEPPLREKKGYAICYVDQAWLYVVDFRGKTAYAKETGQPEQITALGELPDALTLKQPNSAFDIWLNDEWVIDLDIKKQRDIQDAQAKYAQLDAAAKDKISLLNDAVELELAEAGDDEKLKAWRKYRILLSRIDINLAPDIDWPPLP